jgi:hypothetical protein
VAQQLLDWPEQVRGYGVVKTKSIAAMQPLRQSLRATLA